MAQGPIMKRFKMKRQWVINLLVVILFASFSSEISSQSIKEIQEFPLAKGSYWVYKGVTKWTKSNSNEVMEKTLKWKMEIVETIQRDHVYAAILKGHPLDLAWYEDGKDRGDYIIIRVGSGNYYLLRGEEMEKILPQLKREKEFLGGLVKDSQLFLDLPLTPGKVFGEAEQITRQDGSYFWFVESEHQIELKEVKGITSLGKFIQYRLIFRTRPDHQILEFVPGVGITRFQYLHHGTVSETDLRLIEYYRAKK